MPICQTPKRKSSTRRVRTSLPRTPLFALGACAGSDEGAGTQGIALSTPIGTRSDSLLFKVCVAIPHSSQEACPGPENPEPGVFTVSCRAAPNNLAPPENRRRRGLDHDEPRVLGDEVVRERELARSLSRLFRGCSLAHGVHLRGRPFARLRAARLARHQHC